MKKKQKKELIKIILKSLGVLLLYDFIFILYFIK